MLLLLILHKFGRRIYGPHGNEMKYNLERSFDTFVFRLCLKRDMMSTNLLHDIKIIVTSKKYSVMCYLH
jgi:hypothetical protein